MKEIEVLVLGKVFGEKTPETLSLTHFLVKRASEPVDCLFLEKSACDCVDRAFLKKWAVDGVSGAFFGKWTIDGK